MQSMLKLVGLIVAISMTGCLSQARHDQDLEDALKSLAPPNGEGEKIYKYENDTIKRRDVWKDYDIIRSDFFTRDGKLFFTSDRRVSRFMEPELDSSGNLIGFMQLEHFGLSKDGWCVIFGEKGTVRMQHWVLGKLDDELIVVHAEK
ncbi:MAG: hypothetical protein ACK5ST_00105 [bacterium]|jgi:hypothetical protein